MLIIPLELYKRIGGWLYNKFVTEPNDNIKLLIEKEKEYIKNDNKELKKESNNLIGKLGGGILRI